MEIFIAFICGIVGIIVVLLTVISPRTARPLFNGTQTLIILAVNIIGLFLYLAHWAQMDVRTVTKIETKTVEKEKRVEVWKPTEHYKTLMSAAEDLCSVNGSGKPKSFKIDKDNKPEVVCD